jgi:uncharacterized membrane protein YccF (DUF307 family)
MRIIGNLIWLLLGGIVIAIEYLIGSIALIVTIVGIPFGIQTLKMASLAIWPFGRDSRVHSRSSGCLYLLMNVIWLVFGGLWIALTHAILGLVFCLTIIGIPFGLQHFKLTSLGLTPFGRDIVRT